MNEIHSALFQNHNGTFRATCPSSGSTFKILALRPESSRSNARVYSPFGSRMMNRALGLSPACFSDCADASDQRISPATEQDFPLPVFPKTARWRPNNRSGLIFTSALSASGLVPILTRRPSPDSTKSNGAAHSWAEVQQSQLTAMHRHLAERCTLI